VRGLARIALPQWVVVLAQELVRSRTLSPICSGALLLLYLGRPPGGSEWRSNADCVVVGRWDPATIHLAHPGRRWRSRNWKAFG
jgi:hypothetical protein